MTITYSELRKIQRICRDNTGLYDLGDDFLARVASYVSEKKDMIAKNKDKANPFSEEMRVKVQDELKNALKVVDDIFQTREKKTIYRAILSAKKEKPIYDTTNMLEHEKALFKKMIEYIKCHREKTSDRIMNAEKVKKGNDVVLKTKSVMFLEGIPEFVWNDKKYGPFPQEGVENLPEELANLLVKREKAEEVKKNEDSKKPE